MLSFLVGLAIGALLVFWFFSREEPRPNAVWLTATNQGEGERFAVDIGVLLEPGEHGPRMTVIERSSGLPLVFTGHASTHWGLLVDTKTERSALRLDLGGVPIGQRATE